MTVAGATARATGTTPRAAASVAGTLLTLGGALVLVAVVMTSDTAAIVIKWALDPLAHSTSNAGSVLLLLSVAAGCAVSVRAHVTRCPDVIYRRATLALVGVIASGHALAIGGQFALTRGFALPPTLPAYYWHGADNTYSFLLHTHVGKLALQAVASLPGIGAQAYDVGGGLAGIVPGALGVALLLCLLTSSALALWLLPQLRLRTAARPTLCWLYGLAAFNCIKTIADGGPLTYRFLPALLALLFVTGLLRGQRWRGAAIVGGLLSVACWAAVSADDAWRAIGAGLMFVALLLPLAFSGTGARTRLLLGICLGGVALAYALQWRGGPGVLLQPLPAGTELIVVDLETLQLREMAAAGLSAVEAYRAHGDHPLKPRRVFIRLPGAATGAALPVLLLAQEIAPPHRHLRSPLRVDAVRAVHAVPGGALLNIANDARLPAPLADAASALTQNNYYCFLHLLAASLRAQGLREFVLAPVTGHAVQRIVQRG